MNGTGQQELVKARSYYSKTPPPDKSYGFTAYKADDVKQALRGLFHGKCAYCESKYEAVQPVDVEHYRPKGQIEDSPNHPGYWWLAMCWENLLPSCIDCNRRRGQTTAVEGMSLQELEHAYQTGNSSASGKKDAFPTQNAVWVLAEQNPDAIEQPLLIDPTRTDPSHHIRWPVDQELSVAVPVGVSPSRQGEASIHVYGLNRIGLTEARTKVLRELKVRAERVRAILDLTADPGLSEPARQDLITIAQTLVEDIAAYTQPHQPYSALAAAFFEAFQGQLAAEMAEP